MDTAGQLGPVEPRVDEVLPEDPVSEIIQRSTDLSALLLAAVVAAVAMTLFLLLN